VQYCYYVQTDGSVLSAKLFDKLGISKSDRVLLNPSVDVAKKELESMGLDSSRPVYHLPLTRSMKSVLEQMTQIDTIVIEPDWRGGDVYPLGKTKWTRDNYGPIYLPKKGDCLLITPSNYAVYERVIRNYEGNEVMLQDGVVYINGVESNSYTFKMDYYFMMGDNRHQSADSRYWGFVPEDHIVGQPVFVWLSLNKDKGWFDGRIRWDRFMKYAGN
jgi:signal peptidase I